jgi:hypothetical protein
MVANLAILTSCGLDTYIYLFPVSQYYNFPSEQDLYNYISFPTENALNAGTAYFKGFEIYYRIYNNKDTRASDVASINSQNTNYPATVYSYIITTKKYSRLNATTRISSIPLIPRPTVASNETVNIRLYDYGTNLKGITVGGVDYGLALRTVDGVTKIGDSQYSFVFEDIEKNTSSSDISYGTFDDASNKKYYLQAFVLAYGYDDNLKSIYSSSYDLGFITIKDE